MAINLYLGQSYFTKMYNTICLFISYSVMRCRSRLGVYWLWMCLSVHDLLSGVKLVLSA